MHLKKPKREQQGTLAAKSESIIPGCRLIVLMFGYLLSRSAKPTVNWTLANLDFEYVASELKSFPGISSAVTNEVCRCASEERLIILAYEDFFMLGIRR
jgi:hypothetical protein